MYIEGSDSSMTLSVKILHIHSFVSTLCFPGNIQFLLWLLKKTILHAEMAAQHARVYIKSTDFPITHC